jgi:FkbM family methyltransferase
MSIKKKIVLLFRAIKRISNWHEYILDYLGFKKRDIIYSIDNKKIKLRGGTIDKTILTEVLLTNKYFPEWLKFSRGDIVVDAGAHIGIFSVLVDADIVYAIEPSTDNFRMLSEQIKLNNKKIIPVNIALFDKNGKIKLFSGNHSARSSLVRDEGGSKEIVKTKMMKSFFDENKIKKCKLMKIDVEGSEYKILYATPKQTLQKIENILMEVHKVPGESPQELKKFLEKNNFNVELCVDFLYARNKSVVK